ncbi:MAG: zf-HC2 domain-containing protein [Rhodospirillales bacterium]|nr:zf-HC2 domain-containing protein [Rhodospirillales bacterium]
MEPFELSTLMAYADGELDAETAREVEAHLAESAEDRETVRAMRCSAALARAALNEPLTEAVPERLIATVTADRRPRALPSSWRALAAALAGLMIGAGGAVLGLHLVDQPAGPVMTTADLGLREGTLQHTLEKKVSGTDVRWQNPDTGHSGVIAPTRTVQRPDGTFCREYRETTMVGSVADRRFGVACRQADGVWKVRYEILPKDEDAISQGS